MKKFITDLDVRGKKVLIRLDLNVPINKKTGKITSSKRIVEVLPTINYVIERGGKAILFSHFGRVKTKEDRESKTLLPVAEELSKLLGKEIRFIPSTRGKKLETAISRLKDGEVLLIENTRFEDLNNNAESSNDPELGKYWASLGDIFINDAFGTSHRSHASNVGIAENIPVSAIGFLVKKEVLNLDKILNNPPRPFVAIVGGAKVSDKIKVLNTLVNKVDKLIIGGGMAYTFLAAQGIGIGNSLVEVDSINFATEFLKNHINKIVLPVDHVIGKKFEDAMVEYNLDNSIEIPNKYMGLDIGPETGLLIKRYLSGDSELGVEAAKSVFWNGPMGVTEFKNYQAGTKSVVSSIRDLVNAFTVVGGGDSVAAIEQMGAEGYFSHISTGGGAAIEFVEGKTLPGIDVIQDEGQEQIIAPQFIQTPEMQEMDMQISLDLAAQQSLEEYSQNLSNDEIVEREIFPINVAKENETMRVFNDLSTVELEQSLLDDLNAARSVSTTTPLSVEELMAEEVTPMMSTSEFADMIATKEVTQEMPTEEVVFEEEVNFEPVMPTEEVVFEEEVNFDPVMPSEEVVFEEQLSPNDAFDLEETMEQKMATEEFMTMNTIGMDQDEISNELVDEWFEEHDQQMSDPNEMNFETSTLSEIDVLEKNNSDEEIDNFLSQNANGSDEESLFSKETTEDETVITQEQGSKKRGFFAKLFGKK